MGNDPPDGSVVAVMKRSRGIYASLGIAVSCFTNKVIKVKVTLRTGHEGPEVE